MTSRWLTGRRRLQFEVVIGADQAAPLDVHSEQSYRFSMNRTHDYRPGDVVSVPFGGVFRHYGIVSYGGRVISNSRSGGGVISQTLNEFASGRPVRNHGWTEGSDYLALERAHKRLGGDYHLTGSNCVHFVRSARSRKPTVTQVARGTFEAFRDMLGPKKPRW